MKQNYPSLFLHRKSKQSKFSFKIGASDLDQSQSGDRYSATRKIESNYICIGGSTKAKGMIEIKLYYP